METSKITGWGLILLGILSVMYAIYQQTVLREDIEAIHIFLILVMLTSGVTFLWRNKRA